MGTSPTPTPNPLYFTPDLAEFISRKMREISANLNSCLIGKITAINANGTVTAAVSFQKIIRGVVPIPNSNIMGDQIIDYPALVNVPVFTYQGGGAYILMPVAVGDPCLLLFCDRDMDIWFQTGQVAPPNSDRIHNINDAFVLVGINNLQNLLPVNTSGIIQVIDKTGERLAQSGMMVAYGGSTAPSGWLLCQGQSLSTSTYALLFAVIGYTYGGSGGNFNLPDMRGQVPVGLKTGDPNFGSLGNEFGEEVHLLTGPESGIQTHGHTVPGNNGTPGGYGWLPALNINAAYTTDSSLPTANAGPTNAQTPHNNIQPSLVVNWLIKI